MNFDKSIDSFKDEMIKALQGLIRIPSVEGKPGPGKPFGEEVSRALDYALDLARNLGFRVKNVDGYGGFAEFGEGEEVLGILVHLDVVPEGSGWIYPPYGGEIHDGKIYGRGAIDDKGPAIAALYAMKAVMDSGAAVRKKVRMIFGVDEESGWQDMKYFFEREPMPDMGIVPDAEYPVIHAEKGILTVSLEKDFSESGDKAAVIERISGGRRPNMVPDECVCVFSLDVSIDGLMRHLNSFREYSGYDISAEFAADGRPVLRSRGVSAHASTPEQGRNAIGQVLVFLSSLGLGRSEAERFVLLLNDKIGMDFSGRGLGIEVEDEVSGELTLNLGTISVDRKRGEATLNIRYPVRYTKEEILRRIDNSLEGTGIELRVLDHFSPLYVPEDHFLVKTLKNVYARRTEMPARALAIGGGTYARAIKNAVAFGPRFPGRPELAHRKDEYIEIKDLILNAKIYADAIYELAK